METDEGIIVQKPIKRRYKSGNGYSPRKRHKAGSVPCDVLPTLKQLKISKELEMDSKALEREDFQTIVPQKDFTSSSTSDSISATLVKINQISDRMEMVDKFEQVTLNSEKLDGYITPSSSEVDPDESRSVSPVEILQNLFKITK